MAMKSSILSLLFFSALLLIAYVAAQPNSPYLTTEYGTPVDISTMSESVGNDGALLLQDLLLQERLARQNRERIPERTVHARGTTAFGYFVSTTDMSQYTTAALFQGGNTRTEMAVRFSTVIHGQQSPEYLRDPRGFALKFYTSQGNYDIVGINFPIFFIRDGIKFPEFIRSLKPNPASGVSEWWRTLDYFSFVPESTNMLTFLLDDLGIPLSYRHINGSGVHTYVWTNADNQGSYVRYTWVTNQGVESITSDAEAALQDWNFHTTDLVSAINNGSFPSWEFYVQIIPANQKYAYDFNILDTTHQWPEDQIPMQHIGTFTLDRNFQNYFLENEQIAFAPSHLVPGISASDEKMLQARLYSYPDAHRYRLGVNYNLIPVNAPRCPFFQAQQDGRMNVLTYQNPINYWPSMYSNVTESPLLPNVNEDPSNYNNWEEQGFKVRAVIDQVDNFEQPSWRYSTWDSDRQMRFAQRIASTLTTQGVSGDLADLWIQRWTNVSTQLGANIKSLVYSFSQTIPKEELSQPITDKADPMFRLHDNFVQFRSDFLRASGAR